MVPSGLTGEVGRLEGDVKRGDEVSFVFLYLCFVTSEV